MLVIQRPEGGKIDITAPGGIPIVITVLECTPSGCRLGFEADESTILIDRREVTERKQQSQEAKPC